MLFPMDKADQVDKNNSLVSVHPETLVFEGPELLVKEYFS